MDGSEFVPLQHKALLLIKRFYPLMGERPSLHGVINHPPLDGSQSQLLFQANPRCVPECQGGCKSHVGHLSTQSMCAWGGMAV